MGEHVDESTVVRWEQTDPNQSIELAQCRSYREASTLPLVTSYGKFFKFISAPDPERYVKDGPQFIIGPCPTRRAAKNVRCGYVAVIDADKSVTPDGTEVDGAPDPLKVHDALKGWDISHALYSTFSHGSKGNRYRIVFPVYTSCTAELRAFTTYIVEILNGAGLNLALSRESFVWGQGWALPRVAYEGAEFLTLQHLGVLPNAADLEAVYGTAAEQQENMPSGLHDGELNPHSPIGMIEKCLPIQWQLAERGYKFVSQGVMTDSDGREVPVMRYNRPDGTSPGTVVFFSRGRWRVYSHDTNDKLCNGHANDAFDTYMLLNDMEDPAQAMLTLIPVVQEHTHAELNETYPSILEGGVKFRYGNVYTDEFGASQHRMLDQSAFTALMRNGAGVPTVEIRDDGQKKIKMMNRADYWLTCRERTMFNGQVYLPSPVLEDPDLTVLKDGKNYFNTFRTWHVKPVKGKWDLLQWHLRYAICGGSEDEYQYLLTWFAHMFQYPEEKPQVALVLQGGRGWGKTILLSELAKKLGTHSFTVGNNRLLTGNFNSHMRNRLLLVAEESFWSGNHKDRGVLQHLISDQVTGYEKKGFDAEAGMSFLRVVLISNDDWVAPAAKDERRYFLPTLTAASKHADIINGQKGHFFPRLVSELRNGGLEAFIYDLAQLDLQKDSVRTVPETEKLQEQKEMSLDWADRWLMHCLLTKSIVCKEHGAVPWTEGGCTVSAGHLSLALKQNTHVGASYSDRGLMSSLGIRMKKILPRHMLQRLNGPDGARYMLGPLSEVRKAFEMHTGLSIDWGQESADFRERESAQHSGVKH